MIDEYLTVSQTARLLGVTGKSLRDWHKQSKLLPAFMTPGGHRRYLRSEIEAALMRREAHEGQREQRSMSHTDQANRPEEEQC